MPVIGARAVLAGARRQPADREQGLCRGPGLPLERRQVQHVKAWWIETRDEPAEREFLAGLGCRSPHVVRETARERYRSLAARAEDETDRGTADGPADNR